MQMVHNVRKFLKVWLVFKNKLMLSPFVASFNSNSKKTHRSTIFFENAKHFLLLLGSLWPAASEIQFRLLELA